MTTPGMLGDEGQRVLAEQQRDLFPPSVRDPHGIHKGIWDQFKE